MAERGKKIVVGFVLRYIYLILNLALAFFMMPFILHHLGDRMYGLWVLLGSFTGFMGYLDFGLSQTVSRFVARAVGRKEPLAINQIANTSLIMYLGLSVIVLIVTVLLMIGASFFTDTPEDLHIVRVLFLCIGTNLLMSFPARAFSGIISAHLQYQISEMIMIAELVIRYLLIFVFFQLGYGIIALGVIVCVLGICASVAYFIFSFKVDSNLIVNPGKHFKSSLVRELLSYSFYAFVRRITGLLINRTDSFIVSGFLGLAVNAHYAIPVVLNAHLSNFLSRVVQLIDPVFSHDDGKGDQMGIEQKLFISTKIMAFVVVFCCSMFIMYGEQFITCWVGESYTDAYPVLVVLALVTVISILLEPAGSMLFNTSHHKFLALAGTIEGVINLVLSLILVHYLGMLGVALGTLLPILFVRLILQPVYIAKCTKISIRKFVIDVVAWNIAKSLLSTVPFYLFIKSLATAQYSSLFLVGLIHLFIFAAIIWMVGFERQEKEYLLGFVRKKIKV